MFEYDALAALRNAPKLLGMELREKGRNKLEGGYYLNGDLHPYRRDKLKVFIGRGCVWVAEEGGRCISLTQWLMEFGGASDYKDALRMIKGESQALVWTREMREKSRGEVKYVAKEVLEASRLYDLRLCPLFRWMCGLFPEEKVRRVWREYNVTTDGQGNAVFWYVNQDGKILYDKRIAYGEDGHRDKSHFPARKYRVGDGYSGKCYFGAHIINPSKRVYVVESEKSVLLIDLMYGRQAVATGGKNNLRNIESNMVLLPDYDARDEWMNKGAEIWPWWEKWGVPAEQIPGHADIGDMIVAKVCVSGK